jgi:hypothetical protein
MLPVIRLNPQQKGLGANTLTAVAGAPALIYVAVRYAPTIRSKLLFGGLGLALLWANSEALKAAFEGSGGDDGEEG